jgi:hypothetical protein
MPMPAHKPIEDLVGAHFGRLTVRAFLPGFSQYSAVRWRCQCACGRLVTVVDYQLRTRISCGHCPAHWGQRRDQQSSPDQGDTKMERVRLRSNGSMPTTLEGRITHALAPDHEITSSTIATLFGEVEGAIAEAEITAQDSKKKALDPTITDVEAARIHRDDAIYRLERLRAALPPLQARHTELRTAERRADWRKQYATVKAKRDAAASNLKDIYTEFTEKLIDALIEAKAVDQEVAKINSTAPAGEHDRLLTVECAARQVNGIDDSFSLMNLKLPSFQQPNTWAWPPPVPVILPEMVVPAAMLRHPGANWPQALKQRDAERQQEAARVANYYRQQQKDSEDLANARAREEQARRRQAST